MQSRNSLTRFLIFAALGGTLVACDPSNLPFALPSAEEPDVVDDRPPADVQLPPVPSLELVDVPPTYDDGSYSISGLMLNRADLRGSPLRVTAILQTVYHCEEGEAGTTGVEGELAELAAPTDDQDEFAVRPGCLRPHMYFVDSLRSRQRLLVAGYDASIYEPQVVPGRRYTISGSFLQETRGFISTEDGLIETSLIEGDGIVMPDPDADAE